RVVLLLLLAVGRDLPIVFIVVVTVAVTAISSRHRHRSIGAAAGGVCRCCRRCWWWVGVPHLPKRRGFHSFLGRLLPLFTLVSTSSFPALRSHLFRWNPTAIWSSSAVHSMFPLHLFSSM
ncbi:unnamed protein product, partial [Scytosiphon promiscuus]